MTRDRVLSGMRPTGNRHLGNYLAAVANSVRMQDDYECFYFSADWHVLTDHAEDRGDVPAQTVEMFADWLGAGLDPERCTLFAQSLVPDILMYKATWVPVGVDQVPHVELTRAVARRFNTTFGAVFPEPDAKLSEIPKVPGTDGRKMSTSYGNAIYPSDAAEDVVKKVKPMVTDPARKRRADPGNPDVCPVFDLHEIFTPPVDREACATGCRTAGIGCLGCKDVLLTHMLPLLAPIRDRRSFAEKPDRIVDVIHEGSRRARFEAQRTMGEGRSKVRLAP
jgi:tryptophanyl-tRNA synthetase